MWELTLLAVTALAGWLLLDGLRAREAAISVAKDACRRQRVQFLDDTVRGVSLRLARDADGHALIRRTFEFEFSDDGVSRRSGSVIMLGSRAESVQLEPYRLA